MQYNPGDGTGIVDEVFSRLGSGVNLSNYPIAAITRSANSRQNLIWSIIFECYGGWLFGEDGDTSGDASDQKHYADKDIVSGTNFYFLPDGSLTVNGVEIKYYNSGVWYKLPVWTQEEFLRNGGDARFPVDAVPIACILQGNTLRLLPGPNYSQSGSLRVYFDEGMTDFTVDDTTRSPGFASPYHVMLAIGIALDYAEGHTGMENKALQLQKAWNIWEGRLRTYYTNRFKVRLPKRLKPGEDLVEEFS